MKENNKGKRRRLELELAAAREKNLAANRELALMREKVRCAEQGIAQVRRMVDMLLTAATLNCGARVGERAWELVLPGVGPEMLEQWALSLTIERREPPRRDNTEASEAVSRGDSAGAQGKAQGRPEAVLGLPGVGEAIDPPASVPRRDNIEAASGDYILRLSGREAQ